MASSIPLDTLKASLVHPPKVTSVKALVESTDFSSLIPSFYTFTHNLHDEPISDDPDDSIPIIDISLLVSSTPEEQSQVIHQLTKACSDWGCFMVINHGVSESLTKAMIASFQEFFDLPEEEKKEYQGNHVMDPIRCGTGFNPSINKANLWRDFLKCVTHPEFHSPNKPAGFSEIALEFSKRNQEVVTVLLKAISKSLGLEESYIDKAANFELGLQLLAANYYPACPEPEKAIGIPSHYDHGLLTILVNNGVSGLQVKHKEKWFNVNIHPNALFVQVADHLEILSNGKYKSIAHRALVNNKATRMSIALAHGPSLDTVIRPAPELADNESHPLMYVEMTYREFLELQQTGKLRSKFRLNSEQCKAF
ncbi:protein DMR6-LIKE OXYGENASE 2-like [Quercus lobata]|uniref:Fe2OG dioxygenase domain-containing protein n=1 Tax=Quercus lobata TaxID=97700 RepID=A0A7N2MWJ1_QUELO|nr:protein DMR6-LIKE OXYGENASE 2-like [Quercus lobata]